MRIFFDCTYLRNTHTGVDVYFLNLIPEILKNDTQSQYTILVDTRYNTAYLRSQLSAYSNYKIIAIYSPLPLQVLYAAFVLPFYLLIKRIAVYHNPYFFGPLLKFVCPKTKIVITVHDLYHKTVPKMMDKKLNIIFNLFANNAIRMADEIIVISNQTKADVVKHLHVAESKLNLIYQALNQKFNDNGQDKGDNAVSTKTYILTVGKVLPSKGLADLVQAFHILVSKYENLNIKLVSAGVFAGDYVDEIRKLISSLSLTKSQAELLGYVNDDDLNALYRNSAMVVVPSHYEGFGLPILEAMQFGKPVIARNASSLTEIVADAGLLFNTCEELAEQMYKVLTDNAFTMQLVNKGYDRLKDFSWEETARKTIAVYNKQ